MGLGKARLKREQRKRQERHHMMASEFLKKIFYCSMIFSNATAILNLN
jgi:hypothetical protein